MKVLHAFYYDVLSLINGYSDYAVNFSLGQFPSKEVDVIVVLHLILIELIHFPGWQYKFITLFFYQLFMHASLHEEARPCYIIQLTNWIL